MQHISEQEAAVYDRQLRVWGVETQRRLSNSKILILGCTGFAAEVAKNVVLAGVGSVTLVDDTPCSSAAPGNFLIPADANPTQTVAEACVATLQEMNPFVKLASLPGPLAAALSAETMPQYNLVLLCGQHAGLTACADALCSEAGVAFYAAGARGISGWAFANLHTHDYAVENKTTRKDGTTSKATMQHSAKFASWDAAMTCSLKGRNLRRANKLYFVLRACSEFEREHGRPVVAGDLVQLAAIQQRMCEEQGLDPAVLDGQLLEVYATCPEEMPAVNAVVGGILANDLIKAVSQKGEPIRNLFMYSISNNVGSVEEYGS